jgi:hypothetical protein
MVELDDAVQLVGGIVGVGQRALRCRHTPHFSGGPRAGHPAIRHPSIG